MEKNIIIYRDNLLPKSETFILNQFKHLTEYTPYLMGYKKVPNSLDLPSQKMILNNKKPSNKNRFSEVLLKKINFNPVLLNRAKKINPMLIHAHFGPDGVLALPFSKQLNIPLITTFHGYDVTVDDEFLLNQAFNSRNYVRNRLKLSNEGDLFIAVSKFIKQKLIERGFPEEKIITHYIGVDLNQLIVDSSVKRKKSILFVGRLVENKGCHFLIKALDGVFASCPEAELLIVGDGPERKNLEKLAKKHGDKVKFLGIQPYSEVIRLMNQSAVFSVPSIEVQSGASEGFGMVFAEASAMGLPVVSFKTGGIPEAVKDGQTGLLVEPKNVKGLSDSIITLLTNNTLWNQMSDTGMKYVKEEFDISLQTKKLEQIYNELLKNK